MATVYLIRHGQASFGTADYDRLSDLGIRQARLAGEYLAEDGRRSFAIFSGGLRRQVDTATHALAMHGDSLGVTVSASFNEFSANDVLCAFLPLVMQQDAEIAAAEATFQQDRRLYGRALGAAMALWKDGLEAPLAESWIAFRTRVTEGLNAALHGRGKDDAVAVFTSGGVIAMIVGEILSLSPDKVIALTGQIHNASISELWSGRSGLSLVSFNSTGHLRSGGKRELITRW